MKEVQKPVLVLGTAGFIGSALCTRLADLDQQVFALGHSEHTGVEGQVKHLSGSIEDKLLLRERLSLAGPSAGLKNSQ